MDAQCAPDSGFTPTGTITGFPLSVRMYWVMAGDNTCTEKGKIQPLFREGLAWRWGGRQGESGLGCSLVTRANTSPEFGPESNVKTGRSAVSLCSQGSLGR